MKSVKKLSFLCLFLLLLFCACEKKTEEQPTGCEHRWSEDYAVEAPTEEAEGARVYTCVLCGETKETPIPILSEDNYEVIRTEYCEQEGSVQYISTRWGEYTVSLPPAGHRFSYDRENSRVATCTSGGVEISVCERCGQEKRIEKGPLGHDWELVEEIEATCAEKGYTLYRCKRSDCHEELRIDGTDYAHTYVAGEYVLGSCTEKGYTPYVCSNCGAIKNVEGDYNHIYNSETGKCNLCGHACEHSFSDFKCQTCGFDIREELTDRSGYYSYDGLFYFGFYPQSHVSDPDLLADLDELFRNGKKTNTYNGYTYTKENVLNQPTRVYSFSDGTPLSVGLNGGREIHYFRHDPIVWREAREGVLVADCILDIGVFLSEDDYTLSSDNNSSTAYFYDKEQWIYANEWSVSGARSFLLGSFYDTAFSQKQRDLIKVEENENTRSGYFAPDTSKLWLAEQNTEDAVFLPSYADLYEEDAVTDEENAVLMRKASDYVLCKGIRVQDGNTMTANWFLRSAGRYSAMVCGVDGKGILLTEVPVHTINGFVPAIRVQLPE